MKRRLIDIAVCPSCASRFAAGNIRREETDEIFEGALVCSGCGKSYEIKDGVPVLLAGGLTGDIMATRRSFTYAWRKFAAKEVSKGWFKDSFSYLRFLPESIFAGTAQDKIGLDAGCGSGIDMINMQKRGFEMVGIDISDSAYEAFRNTRDLGGVHVVQASIYDMPVRNNAFDIAYSFGVLHHLPDPERGFKALCNKAKAGGAVIIYVYEDFSERSFLERWLLRAVNSLRSITTRMPPAALYLLCAISSPLVFIFCSVPYRILKRITFTKRFAEKIPFRHTARLDCITADLYDRFSPPIERRYARDEVVGWFKRAHFEDVHIINHRGWVAWGRKR